MKCFNFQLSSGGPRCGWNELIQPNCLWWLQINVCGNIARHLPHYTPQNYRRFIQSGNIEMLSYFKSGGALAYVEVERYFIDRICYESFGFKTVLFISLYSHRIPTNDLWDPLSLSFQKEIHSIEDISFCVTWCISSWMQVVWVRLLRVPFAMTDELKTIASGSLGSTCFQRAWTMSFQ